MASPGVTSKVVENELVGPNASTGYAVAAGVAGTTKVLVQEPAALALIKVLTSTELNLSAILGSLAAKPVPVTVTVVPGGPDVGFTAMPAITVKAWLGTWAAVVIAPTASTVCAASVAEGTTKVALQAPAALAVTADGVVALTTASQVTRMLVSLGENPVPFTVTTVPTGPVVGTGPGLAC